MELNTLFASLAFAAYRASLVEINRLDALPTLTTEERQRMSHLGRAINDFAGN